MNMYYYLTPEKDICGPYSRHQIREAVACGSIGAETLCSAAGDETWTPAAQQEWYDESLLYPVVFTCPYCGAEQKEGEVTPRCPGCGRHRIPEFRNPAEYAALSLYRLFQLKGRSVRMEYWAWWLIVFLGYIGIIGCALFDLQSYVDKYMLLCLLLVYMLFVLSSCTVIVRRLHDIGWSGKWASIFIVEELFVWNLFLFLGLSMFFPENILGEIGAFFMNPIYFFIACGLQSIVYVGLLVLGCIDSQRGANKYGPSYKYPRA